MFSRFMKCGVRCILVSVLLISVLLIVVVFLSWLFCNEYVMFLVFSLVVGKFRDRELWNCICMGIVWLDFMFWCWNICFNNCIVWKNWKWCGLVSSCCVMLGLICCFVLDIGWFFFLICWRLVLVGWNCWYVYIV